MIFSWNLLIETLLSVASRLERCNLCYVELEKVKCCLPVLSRYVFPMKIVLQVVAKSQFLSAVLFCRRGGSIAKSAHELNLALQEVSWVTNIQYISALQAGPKVCICGVLADNSCKFMLGGITDRFFILT